MKLQEAVKILKQHKHNLVSNDGLADSSQYDLINAIDVVCNVVNKPEVVDAIESVQLEPDMNASELYQFLNEVCAKG